MIDRFGELHVKLNGFELRCNREANGSEQFVMCELPFGFDNLAVQLRLSDALILERVMGSVNCLTPMMS